MEGLSADAATPSFGSVLRHWRLARRMSQLTLATEAEISSRHLSFLETGRAEPSREMVLLLASVLDVPLREQNALLVAAGFAPIYQETALGAPALDQVRRALGFMLAQQEPYPALVVDRHWNLLMQNEAAGRVFGPCASSPPSPPSERPRTSRSRSCAWSASSPLTLPPRPRPDASPPPEIVTSRVTAVG
jgi:transcriptional regulator with XRE-family HTH domain